MSRPGQTPSQTLGPYFAYGLTPEQYGYPLRSLFGAVIAEDRCAGEHIRVVGQVLDGEGKPVSDAMIEVSQADASGRFATSREQALASGFRCFGRVGTGTDPDNRFEFRTVKPGSIGEGNAPHLSVIVTMRGILSHAFTRVYFDDEAAANAKDPVLAQVPAQRRATLVAKREATPRGTVYRFDIRMQGERETVFFDV